LVGGSERLVRILKLVDRLERLESRSDIGISPILETEHFVAICRTFCRERDVESADMAVELLRHLRPSLNPRWLTPVRDLIQLLVAAGRYDEAYKLSDEVLSGPAGEKFDIGGQPVEFYLRDRCRRPSRQPPPDSADYRRVIVSMTGSWACCRHGLRM
jgi:hypothetical protein